MSGRPLLVDEAVVSCSLACPWWFPVFTEDEAEAAGMPWMVRLHETVACAHVALVHPEWYEAAMGEPAAAGLARWESETPGALWAMAARWAKAVPPCN